MKIVVCVKAVKTGLVQATGTADTPWMINPYDLKALQDCLLLKKKCACELICLCMGPSDVESLLVRIGAMGADQVILLSDSAFAGSDTVATAYILSKAIQNLQQFDLVVFGSQSIDGETGQVVHGVAEHLKQTCLCGVESVTEMEEQYVQLQKSSGEYLLTLEIPLPQTIAFSGFSSVYPLVSLPALKRAKRQGITIWNAQSIGADVRRCGLTGSRTQVVGIENQLPKKHMPILHGTVREKVDAILAALG